VQDFDEVVGNSDPDFRASGLRVTSIVRLGFLATPPLATASHETRSQCYGAETKALNKAVSRNIARFPEDFLFQLGPQEVTALRFQFGTSKGRGGRRYRPWAFTEHGAIMAATVLNSPRAVAMSVYVVRAFVRLRHELLADTALKRRLAQIEETLMAHDVALRDVYEKIRPLLLPPPEKPKRQIGFHAASAGTPRP
jgi:hypothetical protein